MSMNPAPISSATPISGLPPELLQEVFSHLDPISRQRATCVSTLWRDYVIEQTQREQTIRIYELARWILSKCDKDAFTQIARCNFILNQPPFEYDRPLTLQHIKTTLCNLGEHTLFSTLRLPDLRQVKNGFDSKKLPLFFKEILDASINEKSNKFEDEIYVFYKN